MEALLENRFDASIPAIVEKQFLIGFLILADLVISGAGSNQGPESRRILLDRPEAHLSARV
jgi:hypothetical protein